MDNEKSVKLKGSLRSIKTDKPLARQIKENK